MAAIICFLRACHSGSAEAFCLVFQWCPGGRDVCFWVTFPIILLLVLFSLSCQFFCWYNILVSLQCMSWKCRPLNNRLLYSNHIFFWLLLRWLRRSMNHVLRPFKFPLHEWIYWSFDSFKTLAKDIQTHPWFSLCACVCVCVCVCVCSLSRVQLFAILWTSPPGSSVHGIFQARILEWVAISCSTQRSNPHPLL